MKTVTKALLLVGGVLILLGSTSAYVWFIRSTKVYIMSGTSMAPTLKQGDRFVSRRYSYTLASGVMPERGDVVVCEDPIKPGDTLVKRVIGLPGDRLEIREGVVYVNGDRLTEQYVEHPGSDNLPPVVIRPGAVWVMGDNRSHSLDSRHFGELPLARVQAIATSVGP